jgi:pimeloyl-ACP methyl ester carboxylesterase
LRELKPSETALFEMLVIQSHTVLGRMREAIYPGLDLSDADFQNRILQHYEFQFDVDKPSLPFEKPVLIVVGRQDDSVGYRDAWKMMDLFPRASFAVLDKAGHFLTLEQEALFRALTDEWLQRVEEHVASK